MNIFGIGESRRERVKKIRRKERDETLEFRRKERKRKKEIRELEAKTRVEKAEAKLLKARGEKRKARMEQFPYTLPSITIGKKKQRRKLSRKSRITLI